MSDKMRSECPALPKGWIREVVIRKSGQSAGRSDIYYYSPDGKKFRSKPQIAQKLGDSFDMTNFDFRTGCTSEPSSRGKRRKAKVDFHYGKDLSQISITAPRRQMRKVLKGGAVKIIRKDGDFTDENITKTKDNISTKSQASKTKLDDLTKGERKPIQLFWEKRIQGLKAVNIKTNHPISIIKLPDSMKGFKPCQDDRVVFNAIVTNLFMNKNTRIVGQQTSTPNALKKNLVGVCNPMQPMCGPIVLPEQLIIDQEKKVQESRRKLTEALELLKALEDEEDDDGGETDDDISNAS